MMKEKTAPAARDVRNVTTVSSATVLGKWINMHGNLSFGCHNNYQIVMPYNRYTILLFSCVIPTQKPIPILSTSTHGELMLYCIGIMNVYLLYRYTDYVYTVSIISINYAEI